MSVTYKEYIQYTIESTYNMKSVFKILRSLSFLQNTFINERIERAQRLEGLVEKDSRVRKLPLELAASAEKKKGTA